MVKTKPDRIVMENLKVSNIMKNKHLSKAIAKPIECYTNESSLGKIGYYEVGNKQKL
ncbi:hypothetical protein [Clostridium tetani]|uniref:hypothetical protein n=1 Tax=Clostridium tetani TaxID=1513 RepID=UPI001FA75D0A|nr:hypothetical protein [Clostridium tetani]